MPIDMNEVAEKVAEIEGKKEEQNIAQIKETSKALLTVLAKESKEEVGELLDSYKKEEE